MAAAARAACSPPLASWVTATAPIPSTGTPLASVQATSSRADTPRTAGRGGGPAARASAVRGRMIRSISR